MENQKQTLTVLYQDFLDNKTSPEQIRELKKLFNSDDEYTLRVLISEALRHHEGEVRTDEDQRLKQIFSNVKAYISEERKPNRTPLYVRIVVAGAAVIVISIIGARLYFNEQKATLSEATANATIDVAPGTNKAFLTLANGSKISLDDKQNGLLANQSGITTTKNPEGIITYGGAESSTSAAAFNTIETPRGGQFQVQLPDGTKVWLNAASSLRYPLSFATLKERKVELTGEAYFEVAHNKAQPFRVVSNGQIVEALGTHFNVNSYSDEKNTVTTLEEGSVKVMSGNQTEIIRPGQQALSANKNIAVQQADMESALAWKNGNIIFKSANIETIMRQVQRWYNVTVEYEGAIPQRVFSGGMARDTKLSVLLSVFKDSNINFKIEETKTGKKLIVTK